MAALARVGKGFEQVGGLQVRQNLPAVDHDH